MCVCVCVCVCVCLRERVCNILFTAHHSMHAVGQAGALRKPSPPEAACNPTAHRDPGRKRSAVAPRRGRRTGRPSTRTTSPSSRSAHASSHAEFRTHACSPVSFFVLVAFSGSDSFPLPFETQSRLEFPVAKAELKLPTATADGTKKSHHLDASSTVRPTFTLRPTNSTRRSHPMNRISYHNAARSKFASFLASGASEARRLDPTSRPPVPRCVRLRPRKHGL